MKRNELYVGRWYVEFYFATEGYDVDTLLDRLYDFAAPYSVLKQSMELMESGNMNTGFTFCNPYDKRILVAIGPSDSGSEFLNTLVHEIHHVAVAIAEGVGVDLESEIPAYIAGDSAFALAKVICEFGCDGCN